MGRAETVHSDCVGQSRKESLRLSWAEQKGFTQTVGQSRKWFTQTVWGRTENGSLRLFQEQMSRVFAAHGAVPVCTCGFVSAITLSKLLAAMVPVRCWT